VAHGSQRAGISRDRAAARGYRVLSVANTATKEHGIDVIASRDGATVGVEVKGYPSRNYADPARASERKKTQPSTQADHWFAAAVLAAMRLRGKEPDWSSVIALPDFNRYRDLFSETQGSLSAAGISVWWVDEEGAVDFG
jgi:Holliday junction resolvase-like predicted endonuclease